MTIYILIVYLTFVGILSIFHKISTRLFNINCILIFLIITLRGYDIGSVDTINYIDWYLGMGDSMYESGEDTLEPLYVEYIHFLRKFVHNGTIFLLINAFLSLYPLYIIIKEKSENPHLSLMFFFMPLTIMHRFYFVCQRQILAVGVILMGIILFENISKKTYRFAIYILCTIIGFNLQHFSILLALFYVLFRSVSISRINYIILLVGSLVLGLMLGGLKDFSFLADLYLMTQGNYIQLYRYSEAATHAGIANFMQPVTATLIAVGIAAYCDDKTFRSIYSKMYLIGVLFLNILVSTVEVYRLAAMFTIFGLVSLPTMITKMTYSNKYKVLEFVIVLSVVYWYYSYFWTMYSIYTGVKPMGFDTLVPYSFFWEDSYNY